jgi:hypothetical protein
MPGSRHRTPPRSRLVRGVLLLVLAVLAVGAGQLLAGHGHHAYDTNASPPPSYRLTLGKTYQLSTANGVAGLESQGLLDTSKQLSCTGSLLGGQSTAGTSQQHAPLTILSTKDDPRDLHVFATFEVAQSGSYRISCSGIGQVFVDDADNSQDGYSSGLVVLACVAGVFGIGFTISGLAGDFSPDRRPDGGAG